MSRKFSCFPFLQTIGLLQRIFCRIGKGEKKPCSKNASPHSIWQISQPQVMTVVILHLTHIFICIPLLIFCRCDMKLWWKGHAVSSINAFWDRAASPRDYADSLRLPQSHNAFPDNTRTMVIQTYCQQRTISNIMPSVPSSHLGRP